MTGMHGIQAEHCGRRQRQGRPIIAAVLVAAVSLALAVPALAAEPPTVTKVYPSIGPAAGGASVTITGAGFTGATAVNFGSTNATAFEVEEVPGAEPYITAVAPPGTGTVDVTVTTPSGTSATGEADRFTYANPPVIEAEGASHITPSDATLEATINTEGAAPGPQSGVWYQFQLVRNPSEYQTSFACPTPFNPSQCNVGRNIEGSLPLRFLPRASGGQAVSVDLASAGRPLSPSTTYHFRVITANRVFAIDTNQWEPPIVYGEELTFTTPPAATIQPEFKNWPVTGSLTIPKLNQTITLPKDAGFNGIGEINAAHGGLITGKITGALAISPFTTEIEFPLKSGEHQAAGLALTEVGSVNATLTSTASANCPSPIAGTPATCVNLKVPTTQAETFRVVGPGNGLPSKTVSHCQTVEPIKLELSADLTLLELLTVGAHFTGTYTVPPVTCNGKYGVGRGEQMTEELSGPGSYEVNINPPTM